MMAAFSLRSATMGLLCGNALGNATNAPVGGWHFLQDHADGIARGGGGFNGSVSQTADESGFGLGTAPFDQCDLDQWHVRLIQLC